MIPLLPNKTYKIEYAKGRIYNEGDVLYFKTLDKVPEAKHLIRVKNCQSGEIIDLIEILSHPWDGLNEYQGIIPGSEKESMSFSSLKAILPLIISSLLIKESVQAICNFAA